MPRSQSRTPIQNRILASLPSAKYKDLLSNLQAVSLSLSQVLYEAGEPIRHVYFPNSAMISLVAMREGGGRSVEVGVVGEEPKLVVLTEKSDEQSSGLTALVPYPSDLVCACGLFKDYFPHELRTHYISNL